MSSELKNIIFGAVLVLGFWFGWSLAAKAETLDCKTHKLYCKIVEFNPRIDRAFAMEISNKLYAKAKLNRVNPELALAILMHETGLRNLNTYKTTTKVTESCSATDCTRVTTTVDKVFDMSIAQININTAVHYGFDIQRLYKLDMDYALDCFFVVLKDKMKMCSYLGNQAWSCYHSTTESYRNIYVDLVSRHL